MGENLIFIVKMEERQEHFEAYFQCVCKQIGIIQYVHSDFSLWYFTYYFIEHFPLLTYSLRILLRDFLRCVTIHINNMSPYAVPKFSVL